MPQDVGNLLQGRATLKHEGGGAVAELMWSMQATGETASGRRLPDYRSDYTGVNRHIEWRAVPHKDGPALYRRATIVKIVGDSSPSVGRQRQHVDTVGLATANV